MPAFTIQTIGINPLIILEKFIQRVLFVLPCARANLCAKRIHELRKIGLQPLSVTMQSNRQFRESMNKIRRYANRITNDLNHVESSLDFFP